MGVGTTLTRRFWWRSSTVDASRVNHYNCTTCQQISLQPRQVCIATLTRWNRIVAVGLGTMDIAETTATPGAGPSNHGQPGTSTPGHEAMDPIMDSVGQPEAGPSRMSPSRPPNVAPHRHLPKTAYGSIEYLGPVSHPSAILQLASQGDINDCFNSPSSDNPLLEIKYRTDNSGGPIRGYRVPSQKLLVKVVKRKRKNGRGGVFTSEVLGPVSQTVRFRCKWMSSACYTTV